MARGAADSGKSAVFQGKLSRLFGNYWWSRGSASRLGYRTGDVRDRWRPNDEISATLRGKKKHNVQPKTTEKSAEKERREPSVFLWCFPVQTEQVAAFQHTDICYFHFLQNKPKEGAGLSKSLTCTCPRSCSPWRTGCCLKTIQRNREKLQRI